MAVAIGGETSVTVDNKPLSDAGVSLEFHVAGITTVVGDTL